MNRNNCEREIWIMGKGFKISDYMIRLRQITKVLKSKEI
jgi:hypothetical protein